MKLTGLKGEYEIMSDKGFAFQYFDSSMHLRGFSRWYFPQVWFVFNLDVYYIFCIKLIYFGKTFDLNYVFNVNSIFKMFRFSEKWPI